MRTCILILISLVFSLNLLYASDEIESQPVPPEEFKIMNEWDALREQLTGDDNYDPERWEGIINERRGELVQLKDTNEPLARSLSNILNRIEEIHKERKEAQNKPIKRIRLGFGDKGFSSFRWEKVKPDWLDSYFDVSWDEQRYPHIAFMARSPNSVRNFLNLNESGFYTKWHDGAQDQYGVFGLQHNRQDSIQVGLANIETRCGFDIGARWGDYPYSSPFLLKARLEAQAKLFRDNVVLKLVANPDMDSMAKGYFDDEWRAELETRYPLSDSLFLFGSATEERSPAMGRFRALSAGVGIRY